MAVIAGHEKYDGEFEIRIGPAAPAENIDGAAGTGEAETSAADTGKSDADEGRVGTGETR